VVDDFVLWVNTGAAWPEYVGDAGDPEFRFAAHWSFRPIESVATPLRGVPRSGEPAPVPALRSGTEAVLYTALAIDSEWSDHPIDCFIAHPWPQRGLRPVEPANRRTLVRRIYFDLIGIPPAPEEVADFLADDSPEAWERLIDRLLASPHYGERWGRHWMDVVRYADTAGDNADYPIPEARLYRDYIIDSFNADKPYDQFVREQLAGDLLARDGPRDRYAEQIVATGFLALSRRYATAPYEFWHLTLEDTIDTVGQAFLGLTLKCARCHDHKFDPVTTNDYYALYGIFESTQFPWAGGEEFESKRFHRQHFVPLLSEEEAKGREAAFHDRLQKLESEAAALRQRLESATEEERPEIQQRIDALGEEEFQLQRSGLPPDVPGAYAVKEGTAHDAPIQVRGDPRQPGGIVARGAPAFLAAAPLEIPLHESGRRRFADWLAHTENPLTARVMVNRIWQHHFGRGIVATPSNFGVRGAPPTHPELLDYLAARFIESGWSVKAMHRLILTSKTWRLSSQHDEQNAAIDTGNEFLWRSDRRRLDAEALRDALLAVSGRLDLSRPGPHPFPPLKDWHWTQHNPFKEVYPTPHRSVYLMTQRLQRHPFLALFDGPDSNASAEKRTSAIVPSQALYLVNSPEMRVVAESLADRLLAGGADDPARLELAYNLCYCRPPQPEEIARCEECLAALRNELFASTAGEGSIDRLAWTSLARTFLAANEFCYLD
jgi:hypothetical protein